MPGLTRGGSSLEIERKQAIYGPRDSRLHPATQPGTVARMQIPVSFVESEALADAAERVGWDVPRVAGVYASLLHHLHTGRAIFLEPEQLAAFEAAGLLTRDGMTLSAPAYDAYLASEDERRRKNRAKQARWRASRRAQAKASA